MAKLDTQDWRDRYDQMMQKWQGLYNERKPVLEDYEKNVHGVLDGLIGETMPAMRDMYRQVSGISDFVTDEYLPGVKDYLSKAKGYDTEERRQLASQEAMTDVASGAEASRQAALQRLESFGIDPSMTRGAALDQNVRLQTALEQVRQGREAKEGVEERGQAYMRDALGLGAGVQQAGMQAATTGSNLGTSTVSAANNSAANFGQLLGTPVTAMAARKDLLDSSLNAKVTEANFKAQASGGSPWAGIGQTVGTLGGAAAGAYLGSFAGPGGAVAGMQMGSQLGGQAGGSMGGTHASRAAAGF